MLNRQSSSLGLLGPLCVLTLVVLIIQALVIAPKLAANFHIIQIPHAAVIHWLWPAIAWSALMQVLGWMALLFIVWSTTLLWRNVLSLTSSRAFNFGLLLWVLSALWIFAINARFYPHSMFTDWVQTVLPRVVVLSVFYGLSALLGIFFIISLTVVFYRFITRHPRQFSLLLGVFLLLAFFAHYWAAKPTTLMTDKPNIIIIGIDSLRPDFVKHMPHVQAFLQHSTQFTQAYTPLARTFPSWISILSGLYPVHNGVRYDLMAKQHWHVKNSLPFALKAQGYKSYFAIDETLFSNIDKRFGFKKELGPPFGVNTFVLGSYNDLPMSNLFSNTRLGQWMFPYNYANRASTVNYYPQTFSRQLTGFIDNIVYHNSQHAPLLLAMHFCMPHFPYTWAASKVQATHNSAEPADDLTRLYIPALSAADAQFASIMHTLKSQGLLKNAWLVVLSDHGEALGLPGDRITAAKNYQGKSLKKSAFNDWLKSHNSLPLNSSLGHGTDILSLAQTHIVLAIKGYGEHYHSPSNINFTVSSVDLQPTILALLKQHSNSQDGISLLPWINNPRLTAYTGSIYMESSFNPLLKYQKTPTLKQLSDLMREYYKIILSSGRVEISPKRYDSIIHDKQRAILHYPWLLALYPNAKKSGVRVIVNIKSGQWSDDFNSAWVNNKTPALVLMKQLRELYGNEISKSD